MSPFKSLTDHLKRKARLAQAYRDVFDHDAGRAVLADLSREGGLLETSFEPEDPHRTAFNEGRRSMVLHIMAQLRLQPGDIERLARQPVERVFAETGES